MMDLLRFMAVLIDQPWLALIPAALFAGLFAASRSKLALAAAAPWRLYGFYEYAMKHRLLCSGECNIRIDLLAIHPGLLLLSVAGVAGFALCLRKRRSA